MSFSIYLHIPYCRVKCPYCDFNVYAPRRWPEDEYVETLIRELACYAHEDDWQGRAVRTVFFGGGTPSLFRPLSIDRIMTAIHRNWPVQDEVEVSLEANPGTVSRQTLHELRSAGVTRLSLGVQSFASRFLRRLGRDHDSREAVESIELSMGAGFPTVGVDLMFAIPEQTPEDWQCDLERVIELGPHHVSAYNLTYEEGTLFHRRRTQGRIPVVENDVEAEMFAMADSLLERAGFTHYEISNYARAGHRCRHNLNYWAAGEYLGVGAGAHSHRRHPGFGRRWSNVLRPADYMRRVRADGHARAAVEELDESQARGEMVFLGLRRREGISDSEFRERFAIDLRAAFPHVDALYREGLLEHRHGHWCLTPRGREVADELFASFL